MENDQKIRDGPDEGLDREIVFAVKCDLTQGQPEFCTTHNRKKNF